MKSLLVAVDGSASSLRAVRYAIDLVKQVGDGEIRLINVQESTAPYGAIPIPGIDTLLEEKLAPLQRDVGKRALADAERELRASEVRHQAEVFVGNVAETIADQAKRHGCDGIVIGTRGMTSLSNLVLGSIATRVIHHATVPVTLVK